MELREQKQNLYRLRKLRLKRKIRYKLIVAVGCILLVMLVIFMADIWFIQREKFRLFGHSDQSYNYQVAGEMMNMFSFDGQETGVVRNFRQEMEDGSGSGSNMSNETREDDQVFRRQFPPDLFTLEQKRMGAIILHIIGIIYMFAALALVCDEFFVPCLEIIIEKFHIPEDVAGATFMAAGGSAPEFFTSLAGVFFARNAVGFGTIVGSAVFNILFVIGVVGLLAKHTLLLTWWPLFRDTLFYTIALGTLIGFFQNGLIEWYESLVLFILYILYVLFMFINSPAEKYSRKLVRKIQDKLQCCKCPCSKSTLRVAPESAGSSERAMPSEQGSRKSLLGSTILVRPADSSSVNSEGNGSLQRFKPTSRAQWTEVSSAKQTANAHHSVRTDPTDLDLTEKDTTYGNNNLNPIIQESISTPGRDGTHFKLPPLGPDKMSNGNNSTRALLNLPSLKKRRGSIDSGFRTSSSYAGSDVDTPISNETSMSRFSSNRSSIVTAIIMKQDSAYPEDVESITSTVDVVKNDRDKGVMMRRRSLNGSQSIKSATPDASLTSMGGEGTSITAEERAQSTTSDKQEEVEEGDDDEDEGIVHIIPPKGWPKRIAYIVFLPLIILLFFTLPDVKKPRWRCFFPYVFVGSILWIAVFSYFMVWWATEFGDTANIPPSVMGLTLLAAGTSIPDLITSVIVARKGFGDMALSSSIGSNMFDVTVGLPIPWLLFSATQSGQPVTVISNGLFCSVLLLVGMLLLMIISIAIFRWKLGRLLGLVYLVMYVAFVTLSILLELVIYCTIGG